jgi:DNA topoisomerase IA
MSEYYSVLFLWSKGAFIRRKILLEVHNAEKNRSPIFVTRLQQILINKMEKKPSRSTIRKHVNVLLEFNYIRIINKEGKPKYLALTDLGEKVISLLRNQSDSDMKKKISNSI